jgi:protein O-mannosyl-transferase
VTLHGSATRARVWVASLVIVAAIAIVYRHAPGGYWFEDDFQWLVSRSAFQPFHVLHIEIYDHFYRPVIELYFWAALRVFGRSATLFHIANVVLHAANALLLLLLARTISGGVRYGFIAALSFAVMPAYVEAIGWVSALAEPLAAFFGLPAIYFWIRFRQSGRRALQVATIAMFALSLLTHESSLVFLALLGLADLAFAGAWPLLHTVRGWGQLVRDYLPLVVVSAAYLAIDLTVNSRSYVVNDGLYRVGPHAIRNVFSYIASLYVGGQSGMRRRRWSSPCCSGAARRECGSRPPGSCWASCRSRSSRGTTSPAISTCPPSGSGSCWPMASNGWMARSRVVSRIVRV